MSNVLIVVVMLVSNYVSYKYGFYVGVSKKVKFMLRKIEEKKRG